MNKQKEILNIEEAAQKLTEDLGELYEQVGSYKTAKEELEKTREDLSGFIEVTQSLANEAHKTIKRVNEIGVTEILDRIEETQLVVEKTNKTIKKINEDGVNKILNSLTVGFVILGILGIVIIWKIF